MCMCGPGLTCVLDLGGRTGLGPGYPVYICHEDLHTSKACPKDQESSLLIATTNGNLGNGPNASIPHENTDIFTGNNHEQPITKIQANITSPIETSTARSKTDRKSVRNTPQDKQQRNKYLLLLQKISNIFKVELDKEEGNGPQTNRMELDGQRMIEVRPRVVLGSIHDSKQENSTVPRPASLNRNTPEPCSPERYSKATLGKKQLTQSNLLLERDPSIQVQNISQTGGMSLTGGTSTSQLKTGGTRPPQPREDYSQQPTPFCDKLKSSINFPSTSEGESQHFFFLCKILILLYEQHKSLSPKLGASLYPLNYDYLKPSTTPKQAVASPSRYEQELQMLLGGKRDKHNAMPKERNSPSPRFRADTIGP